MRIEDFEKVKREMGAAQLERESKLPGLAAGEQERVYEEMALRLQLNWRGYKGRTSAQDRFASIVEGAMQTKGSVKIQALVRGFVARAKVRKLLEAETRELVVGSHATYIQKMFRGCVRRRRVSLIRRNLASRLVQRVFRGHLGRQAAKRELQRLELLRRRAFAATKAQACWKMMVAREEYRLMRVHVVAAVELQRVYRGHLGRKKVCGIRRFVMCRCLCGIARSFGIPRYTPPTCVCPPDTLRALLLFFILYSSFS